jgi:glutathione S-transferase
MTPKEKGVIHMMQKRAESELIDAVGIYFHHATPGLGAALQVHKSPEWAHREEWGKREGERAVQGMKYFDRVLKTEPFVAGKQFSMADITVFAGLSFADIAGIAIPEECTTLKAWRAKVAELPSVKNRSGKDLGPEDLSRLGF